MRLPMFPLGTVHVPGTVLVLRVFEPRYRRLVADLGGSGGSFGVVLIERGSEVGGGDVRTAVGTRTRVRHQETLPDGDVVLITAGEERVAVERWLADDPYPRAEVAPAPEDPAGSDAPARIVALAEAVRGVRALAGRLEYPLVPPQMVLGEPERVLGEVADTRAEPGDPDLAALLSPDPLLASHQLCALAPLELLDRQRLLAAPGVDGRLDLLAELLEDRRQLLELERRAP